MMERILYWGMKTHGLWCGFRAFGIKHSHRWRVAGKRITWEEI